MCYVIQFLQLQSSYYCSHLTRKELRHKEVRSLAQDHTASSGQQSGFSNPGTAWQSTNYQAFCFAASPKSNAWCLRERAGSPTRCSRSSEQKWPLLTIPFLPFTSWQWGHWDSEDHCNNNMFLKSELYRMLWGYAFTCFKEVYKC